MRKFAAFALWLSVCGLVAAGERASFSISDPLSGKNGHPVISYNSASNQYLVFWVNRTDMKLYCRVVKSTGSPVGNPIAVSTKEVQAGDEFAVAFNTTNKEFLVVWETATDGSASDILYATRVSPLGSIRGKALKIAGQPKKLNWHPAVAYSATDNAYLVIWSKEGLLTPDGGGLPPAPDGICEIFISGEGKPIGGEDLMQEMSYLEKGGWLWHLGYQGFDLHWKDNNSYALLVNHITAAGDNGKCDIEFLNINSSGTRVGKATKVNKTAAGNRSVFAALAENTLTGQWLAAWESVSKVSRRTTGRIYTRVLSPTGTPSTPEQVTFNNDQECGLPSLSFNPDKSNFLLALDADINLKYRVNWDVLGQIVAVDGSKSGNVFTIAGGDTSQAEHSLTYNPTAKNYFVAFASVVGANKIKINGTIIQPQ